MVIGMIETGCSGHSFGLNGSAKNNNNTPNSSTTAGNTDKTAADDSVSEPVMIGGAYLTCTFADTSASAAQGGVADCYYSIGQQKVTLRKGVEIKVYTMQNNAKVLLSDMTLSDAATDTFSFTAKAQSTGTLDIEVDVLVGGSLLQARNVTVAAKGAVPTPAPPPAATPAPIISDSALAAIAPELLDRAAVKRLVDANSQNIQLRVGLTCTGFVGQPWFVSDDPTVVYVDDGAQHLLGQPDNFVWTCATSPVADSVYRGDCLHGARDYSSCNP